MLTSDSKTNNLKLFSEFKPNNPRQTLTDLIHQGGDDGQRRPLQCRIIGVRVRDED